MTFVPTLNIEDNVSLYVDHLADPESRALSVCLALTGKAFTEVPLSTSLEGVNDAAAPWYSVGVNPLGTVPGMRHGNFVLPGTLSILRYLTDVGIIRCTDGQPCGMALCGSSLRAPDSAESADTPDTPYTPDTPDTPETYAATCRIARIESALEWIVVKLLPSLRRVAQGRVRYSADGPVPQAHVTPLTDAEASSLWESPDMQVMGDYFLLHTPFLASDALSAADVIALCALDQVLLLGLCDASSFPGAVVEWRARVEDAVSAASEGALVRVRRSLTDIEKILVVELKKAPSSA